MDCEPAIRRAAERDVQRISEIYNWYVLNTAVTFETDAVEQPEMWQRILDKLATHDWLVAEAHDEIIGFAYYGVFRSRPAYFHTVETTIYLSQESTGKGAGPKLYSALIHSAAEKGFRELIGVISLPNPASIKLHSRLGFRENGRLQGVGRKFGNYIDVALWQRGTEM
jgi:phosphinothricin acetyltransferase